MSFAAAIGIGNDSAMKELKKLNRNFSKLLEVNLTAHKQTAKIVEKQDNIIKRMLQSASKAYHDTPIISDGNTGMIRDMKNDEGQAMALLLGGGLLAGALIMGQSFLKNIGGFFGSVEEKVLDEMGLDSDDTKSESPTASAPASVSPAPSAAEAPSNVSASTGSASGSWKPVLDMIAHGEAHKGSYDSIYPSSIKPGLSKMTIAQADAWQARTAGSRGSAAAGRYQFMEIRKQAAAAGIGPNEKFSPSNQDKMAVALIEKKRGVSLDMARKNPNEALRRLAPEWAGLPKDSGGLSYYDGDGRNKATISYKHAISAFKKLQTGGLLGKAKQAMANMIGIGKDKSAQRGGSPKPKPKYGLQHFITVMNDAGITDKTERAMFLAQVAHETGDWKHNTELKPKSYYEGSKDLGNTQPGDGKRFLGRGYLQLTGRWNYNHFGNKIGVDLIKNPKLAAEPENAGKLAVEFWKARVNRDAARKGDVRGATLGINPKLHHLDDRKKKFKFYLEKGYQEGGKVKEKPATNFVMPKPKKSRINITPEPAAKLQVGGQTSADKLKSLHNDTFVGNVQKRRSRSVIIIKTKTKMIPVAQGGGDNAKSFRGGGGMPYNASLTAKTMYRVQKGAFT